MKKTISLLLALAMMCTLLAGCTSGTSSEPGGESAGTESPASTGSDAAQPTGEDTASVETTESGETVVYVSINDGDPGTLDPFAIASSAYLQACMQLYDKLLDMDDEGNIVGSLAKEYTREGDTLTFTLYDNIYDTAGNHFTASDAVFCLNKMRENAVVDASSFVNPQVVDEYTFTVDIVSETVTTLNSFTSLMFVTQAAYEACDNNMSVDVISTGPYKLESYVTGSTLTLVKNEDYWQENKTVTSQKQNVDKIVYNFMTEASQIVVNLESGVVDFAFVDWTVADRFLNGEVSGNFNADEVQTWGGNDLWFNMSEESVFYDNVNLRKAIFYAIDNQAIVDAVWNGHAQNPKAYGNYNYSDADPAWQNEDYFDYNPELAQQYFDQSGYKAGDLTLTLIYPSSSYCDNMAEIIQGYLSVLGISVEIQGLENAIYNEYKDDPTKYDIMFQGGGGDGSITRIWAVRLDQNAFSGDYCTAFVKDDELQALVEAACTPATHNQETVNAVHYYLKDAAYVMRLYIEYKCCVTNADKIVTPFVNTDARPVPGAFVYTWNQ